MKNTIKALFAGAMAISLAACSSTAASSSKSASASSSDSASATEEATGEQTAEYTLVNKTGETVTELYQYVSEDDKGDNLAGTDGMAANATITSTVKMDASETADYKCTLEFTTASGYTGKFTTLSFETVTINLLSEDAASGATQIEFVTE